MPSLSFIKPKTTKWKAIVSNRSPFPPSRGDNLNIGSSHPYASPDILNINDSISSQRSTPEPPPKSPAPRHLTPPGSRPLPATSSTLPAPPVQIDIDISSEPFDSDWFQTHVTESPSSPWFKDKGKVCNRVAVGKTRAVEVARASHLAINRPPIVVDEDDDVEMSSSEDDVLGDLKAMDPSTILGISPPSNKMVPQPPSAVKRRTPPAPIKVPNFHMHGSQVQLVRSGEAKSRPLSEVSSVESSAVSGQTLARALLGNSFILSGDSRSSRYRSGFGGLVRSDSATLPRGDHPLINSPYGKDRPPSGLVDNFAIGNDAPPIPANADKVYVPPRAPRTSSLELKKHHVRRPSSTSSLTSLKDESSHLKSRPSSFSDFSHEVERIDVQASRRISRISEAPSTPSTAALNTENNLPKPLSESPIKPPFPVEPSVPLPSESSSHLPSAPGNHEPPALSVASNNESKDLDVVDYYASEIQKTFAPVFSPITEESGSQLSTPACRRLSQQGIPTARAISPLSGTLNGRIDLSSVRRPSDGAVIHRSSSSYRRSIQSPPDPNTPTPSTSSDHNVNGGSPGRRVSVSGRVVGGRLRSGSTPGPIKVTRDSKYYNIYKIVSPFPDNLPEAHLAADHGLEMQQTQQTFPETPYAFSPYWASRANSPAMVQGASAEQHIPTVPQPPSPSLLPYTKEPHENSDRQILTRAATVGQARHSRQSNFAGRMLPQPQAPAIMPDDGITSDGDVATREEQIVHAPHSKPTETSPTTSDSHYSASNEEFRHSFDEHYTGFAVIEAVLASPWPGTSSPTSSPPTQNDTPPPTRIHTSQSLTSAVTSTKGRAFLSNNPGAAYRIPASQNVQTNSPHSSQRTLVSSPHNRSVQASPPFVITPPAGQPTPTSSSPYLGRSLRRISETSHNFESPPPYDTIDYDRPPSITPTLSHSNDERHFIRESPASLSAAVDSNNESSSLGRKASTSRDRRVRPKPGGPRRPVSNLPGPGRGRVPSVSSAISSASHVAKTSPRNPFGTPSLESRVPYSDPLEPGPSFSHNNTLAHTPITPNFNVPPTPYRGLTMDQAKWTFTSSQLQCVVSRAIKQSAEASSIRLLQLNTLDDEIPQDLKRLEAQKSEIKIKYQSLTRTSKLLFSKLNNQITSGSGNMQRTTDELKDTMQQLNMLTEQLHAVDRQHAEIEKLVEVHSASALSMALRKLNASFLKQLAETKELRRQIGDMEEEIWSLRELSRKTSSDNQPQIFPSLGSSSQQTGSKSHMTEFPGVGSSSELEKKRVPLSSLSRMSSFRYSRSTTFSGRASHRSSWCSSGTRGSMVGGTSGTRSSFRIPPVPPLPGKRPTNIVTELPRRSTVVLADDGTPDTEVRAIMHAQEELYQSLGMSLGGDIRMSRSHSIIGLPGSPEIQPHPSTTEANTISPNSPPTRLSRLGRGSSLSRNGASTRPVSYPASLLDAYNRLDTDRHAMLTTLEIMSQDDQ